MTDRLGTARQLLRAAAGAAAASLALLVAVAVSCAPGPDGSRADPRPALARSTGALALAFVPAGQPLRAPEARSPALDPRHSGGLPAELEPALAAPPRR